MAVYASVDGIQIEYDPGYGEPSQLDQIVDAVKALSPELRKLLKKVGYDRIKAKGINDPGFTPDCPLGDQADIEINPDLSDDIKRTINHELGHALDDILGEQNGTGRYHNSNTFDAARVADGAAQATNPPAGIDPAEVAASNNFYDNNRAEFIADVNMAISEIAQGRGDTKSVYGQKLTAQQIAQLYPVSADVLKGQIQFALNRMADGGGADQSNRSCGDFDWQGGFKYLGFRWRIRSATETFGTDPLILDLDGNGIETTTLDSGIYFDVANSGFGSKMAWAAGNDGILGIDLNGNGYIDNGSELIGAQMAFTPGIDSFISLAAQDSNHDGQINSLDNSFQQLLVQQADGKTRTLEQLGIVSISLNKTVTGITDPSGNDQTSVSTFTWSGGGTGAVGSYVLQQDSAETLDFNPTLELSPEILALPRAAGGGTVRNLSQAMQADSSGALSGILQSFLAETNLEVQDHLLHQLLVKWTGSENAPPALHMDPQIFSIIEKFAGTNLTFPGTGDQPGYEHQLILQPAYTEIKNAVYAQLMFNGGPLDDIRIILKSNYTFDEALCANNE